MRFVSEDILIISISAQAVIPPNTVSPVWAHYLCHKNTISMIITGFIYKPEHKASALKISRGRRRGREKFNKSYRGTKLPMLILQLLFSQKARGRAGPRWLGSLLITPDLYEGRIDGALWTFSTVKLSLWTPDFYCAMPLPQGVENLWGCLLAPVFDNFQIFIWVSIHMESQLAETEQFFK